MTVKQSKLSNAQSHIGRIIASGRLASVYADKRKNIHIAVCQSTQEQELDRKYELIGIYSETPSRAQLRDDLDLCEHEFGQVDDCIRCIHCFKLPR